MAAHLLFATGFPMLLSYNDPVERVGAVTVVYLDSVFVLNVLMDYILFLSTARLAGISLCRWRYLLAALAGGGYAVAVFLPGGGFLTEPTVKLSVGVLLSLIAFGGERRLLRLVLLLLLLACALAGGVLALGLLAGGGVPVIGGIFYTDVNTGILLAAATAAYVLLSVVFRASGRHGIRGQLLPVRLCIEGRTKEFTALWDSGNTLTDPETGAPVLVVSWNSVKGLFPWIARPDPTELEVLLRTKPECSPRLLSYRAVGTSGGLLLSVRSDWVEIWKRRYPELRVALTPTELGDGYAALWGGERGRGGRFEGAGSVERDVDMAGTAACGGHSLHRRQRHASAAAGKGAGGGASGETA